MIWKRKKMKVVLDLEADGLTPTKIWCIVCKDIETDKVYTWEPDDVKDFHKFAEDITTWIGHNLIGYDLPVLRRLLGINVPLDRVVDTLVVSRLLDSQRGSHSLAKWGERLEYPKVEHDEWDRYSPEMLHRCTEDVHLNQLVFDKLLAEKKEKKTPQSVFRGEHRIAEIVEDMRMGGILFDERGAQLLLATLSQRKGELDDELLKTFVSLPSFKRLVTPKYKKDGTLSAVGLKGFLPSQISGNPFSYVTWPEPNLNSQAFLVRHLQNAGWVPTVFTDAGNARLTEWVLEAAAIKFPKAKQLMEWDLVDRRITMVNSWIDASDNKDRIHGSVNTIGAKTHRMSHWGPNMAQVPASDKPYGKDCRSLFTVPAGYRLLGTDASGIQLRVLAHYTGDKDYITEVCDGDIHTANQKAGGFKTRDIAKTFIYAWLLGAGAPKIGEIMGESAKEGGKARKQFLDNTPALKRAKYKYEKLAERGHILALDNRWVPIVDSYYTLSVLLQSGEAILMKKAAEIWTEKAKHLDWNLVAWVHDEWQTEVKEEHAEELGRLQVDAIKEAGVEFNFKCPLDGEYKIGYNWEETH
jgi:DNA polymerase-1